MANCLQNCNRPEFAILTDRAYKHRRGAHYLPAYKALTALKTRIEHEAEVHSRLGKPPPTPEFAVPYTADPIACSSAKSNSSTRLSDLHREIEHAAHFLPTQGPISIFIHHNTLHAFEHLPFDKAIVKAQQILGCEPYLSEARYRRELESGRMLPQDLQVVLLESLDDRGDELLGSLGTRHELQLAMLRYPLFDGSDSEIRWFIDEADALFKFRADVIPAVRRRLLDSTKRWVQRDLLGTSSDIDPPSRGIGRADLTKLLAQHDLANLENWSEQSWESVTLHLLWRLSWNCVSDLPLRVAASREVVRHRDALLSRTGKDIDSVVNAELTRFCAAYLDQGYASWQLPNREEGFWRSYNALVQHSHPVETWLQGLPAELVRLDQARIEPLESIAESLEILGVSREEESDYLSLTLLALRGWAGMLWQMETNGEWTVRPAHKNSLVEYLAVRLILERLALEYFAREDLSFIGPLSELRQYCHVPRDSHATSVERRAFQVFQLAQLRCWSPAELNRLSSTEWQDLVDEMEAFDSLERRRLYHLAYERRYRTQTLDAISIFSQRHPERTDTNSRSTLPAYQVVCCIDDREESFRRQLEEIDSEVETFAIAGFFGVAMYYRGAAEAQYRPLCPIVIKPQHYVVEQPAFSLDGSAARQADARRRIGSLSHHVHRQSRTAVGGLLAGMFGSVTSLPLVMRILFPRLTAKLADRFRRAVEPPKTQLRIERTTAKPGPNDDDLGYTVDEMVKIVEGGLRALGMARDLAPLVFIFGHGSGSINNPHEAAYDCGACGGGRGGPNARAFAAMANDLRVRDILATRGLVIPHEVYFIGAFHNTCDDSITYFDLEKLPPGKWQLFNRAKTSLDAARQADAQERCRRFESAPFSLTPQGALKHVENRSEDLSQVRPEYCHATNAVCIVGRRARTRGLFLDRRSFLNSYDPTQDTPDHAILAGLLGAAIPVCAGISLEYYFSAVDNVGYGCGSKLPHNVTSLLGVMEGAESDLRTGLSAQMIEIHEPMRILFVVETTPEAMLSIMDRDETINQLVRNDWVQLSLLDPHSDQMYLYAKGGFELYHPEDYSLPVVAKSTDWYRGWRKHLGYAEVTASNGKDDLIAGVAS